MSSKKSSQSKSKKKSPKKEKAFTGLVIGIFEDIGPVARYHNIRLPKELINRMVIHGMSTVHGGEDILGGLYGPLPIFDRVNMSYLIYSFKVTASNTKDSRIAEHGRVCSLFLILKDDQERYALNNHLTIEKLVTDYHNENWLKELDITKDSMLVLYEKLNETVKVKRIRSFSFGKAGLIEYADPQLILDEGIISILNDKTNKVSMYLPHEKFTSKERIIAVEKMEELNKQEYSSTLKIVKYRDYLKFKKVLDKLAIQLVK